MCGEHCTVVKSGRERGGSSPRVRGTLRCYPFKWRITSVHPRVCGEHPSTTGVKADNSRFIPACAGNTFTTSSRNCASPVHPRVCGEHFLTVSRISAASGSSPRVRGTPRRRRGLRYHGGSSPRVRGTHQARRARLDLVRFIPACAGNTHHAIFVTSPITVHPRVCGEHIRCRWRCKGRRGSSPRVRGTQVPYPDSSPRVRGTVRREHGSSPRVRGTHFLEPSGSKGECA